MNNKNKFRRKWYWILFIVAICTVSGINIIGSFAFQQTELTELQVPSTIQSVETKSTVDDSSSEITELSIINHQENNSSTSEVALSKAIPEPTKLGHFPYQEARENDLVIVASYAQGQYQRYERLHKDAAMALMRMIYAARDSRVWIVPVSGYRDIEKQDYLFKAQVRRRGSEEAAAKLSAPPGHSEHHTGYTIDLTDGLYLNQDITYKFASSDAYKWLVAHAYKFGFELSFPENNSQGVSFEPWHWRYIGSSDALKTFARARENQ